MRKFFVSLALIALSAFILSACGQAPATPTVPPLPTSAPPTATTAAAATPVNGDPITTDPSTAGQPEHITVQHILIAFAGTGTKATRTQAEAKTLAYELFDRAKKGEDYLALVTKYTDDAAPGIYSMSNIGVTPAADGSEYARQGMVPAFGDVGFPLQVG
ncbi:MAG: peptidylprolyl isomerase, partial [Chloroflexia bacterium]